MYVRITRAEIQPGRWGAFAEAYRKNIDPNAGAGLEARLLVRCPGTHGNDVSVAISLWTSESAAQAYADSDYYQQTFNEHLGGYFVGPVLEAHGPAELIETYE